MREKLSFKEKFSYGLGDMSANIMFSAISFYLLYFFINVGGLKAELASVVFLVARLWDAVTDYMMGRISDKTKSKFGKRRVYMLFGALPYGLAFILLWLTPFGEGSQAAKLIYYLVVYMVYNTAWTVVYIPYSALTANMTADYDERTSINGFRIALANLGILLGAAFFALLADGTESLFYGVFGSQSKAYAVSAIIFGLLASGIMLLSFAGTKERVDTSEKNDKGFFRTLKEFFKLKEFRNVMMCYLLSMIGFDIIMAVFMFFINDALGFGGGAMSMIFVAIPLVMAIASSLLWVKLSEKFQKHKVYAASCVYMAVVLIFAIFVPELTVWSTVLLCVFAGIGMSAIQILPYASVPDVVEVDEYVNGVRREGAYYGITQFMYKIASGASVALVSLVLGLFGYIESTDGSVIQQPEDALFAIRIVLGVVPGVIFLLSIISAFRANLSRERFDFVKSELKIRKDAALAAGESAAEPSLQTAAEESSFQTAAEDTAPNDSEKIVFTTETAEPPTAQIDGADDAK